MQKCSKILLFVLVALFGSCQQNEEKLEIVEKFVFPMIMDTFEFINSSKQAIYLSEGNYKFLYVGEYKDTIFSNYRLHLYELPPPPPPPSLNKKNKQKTEKNGEELTITDFMEGNTVGWMAANYFKHWDSSKIEITIDTAKEISNVNFKDSFICATAHPVLLKNMEKDTVLLGVGSYEIYIPLILEAKDSLGIWKPIEKIKKFRGCGNGFRYGIIPKKQVVLTSSVIYHGDYKTDLRLKLGINYSKPFKGSIHYKQFIDIGE